MEDIENKFPNSLKDVPVKLLKLISGESIIAYVHNDDKDTISLEEPMCLSYENEYQIVFTPYLPFSENVLHHIDIDNIMFESDVNVDIKAYYMKILLDQVEGIETPSLSPTIPIIKGTSTVH